jgi:hypothetical protein
MIGKHQRGDLVETPAAQAGIDAGGFTDVARTGHDDSVAGTIPDDCA